MKMIYEAPEAEVICFRALENLAVVQEPAGNENMGPTPEGSVGSKDW